MRWSPGKIDRLRTDKEEAATRIFLRVKMTELDGHQNAPIISLDTNAFVLSVTSASAIPIYQERGEPDATFFAPEQRRFNPINDLNVNMTFISKTIDRS